MGIIRGGLFVIVSVLLLVCLIAGNVFWAVSMSLNYDIVEPRINGIATELVNNNIDFNVLLPVLDLYCVNNSEYVFFEPKLGTTFSIPCESVNSGESVVAFIISEAVYDFYYQEYDCDFWNCFSQTSSPGFLVSEHAKDYWNSKFYFAIFISLILIAILFLLAESKSNALIVTGILTFVSALVFIKIDYFLEFLAKIVIDNISDISFLDVSSVVEIFAIFFTKSDFVFVKMLVFGVVILLAGIIWKLIKVGFKVSHLFEKFKNIFSKKRVEVQSSTTQNNTENKKIVN